jgi:hypothetical protein
MTNGRNQKRYQPVISIVLFDSGNIKSVIVMNLKGGTETNKDGILHFYERGFFWPVVEKHVPAHKRVWAVQGG